MTRDTRPNVVFVVLDTCRADVFYDLLDTGRLPGIERIAADARIYRNSSSAAPWTVPSHGSMFSGLYPTDHGTSANDPYFDPPTTPLAEKLRAAGYDTAGLSANPWITPSFDFTTGFKRFKTAEEWFWGGEDISDVPKLASRREQVTELLDRTSPADLPKTLANAVYAKFFSKRADSGAKHLTNTAVKWLTEGQSESPFFLFCNYMEPHIRYDPPTRFLAEELPDDADKATARSVNQDQWAYVAGDVTMTDRDFELLQCLYRATIRYLDTQLVRLYDTLADEGLLNDTAIVLVGDHGENIGEHGLMDHQYCLYETLLHVPLVIRYPAAFDPGTTGALVETRALYETVADLAGLDPADADTAPSLVSDERREYAIAEYTSPQPPVDTLNEEYGPLNDSVWRFDRALRSVRSERWKFVEGSDGETELYDLRADSDESDPVDDEMIASRLRDVLDTRRGPLDDPGTESADIDEASKERLQDLGYL
ncbi:sulfatase-like hydrolase/transferase [Salinigranum sp. GCM10025319]|uniref:sulfatase-like hydrolase/transferase n=1 Tax=Salinigranum sp. GCM10025319 TaxID=3252687 RepID=UPI00360B0F1F